jgi:uncharacterized protein (TIGR00369 family)
MAARTVPSEPKSVPMGLLDTLGIEIGEIQDGVSQIHLMVEARHHNYVGSVHGGAIATLIDTAIARAIRAAVDEDHSIATVTLNLVFIRAVSNGMLEARGRVNFKGNRLAHGEAEVYAGDQLIARGIGTWYVSRTK